MKVITIAGNCGKDAEVRHTPDGQSVTGFTVAVTDRKKATTWFDVTMWGKRGEAISGYVRKGDKIVVTGELGTREHNGKTYLTVNAADVTLMGGGKREEPSGYAEPQRGGGPMGDIDDAIPFTPEWRA